MKVVNVSSADWANFSFNFSQSLRSVGVDSYSYALSSHVFGYDKQSEVVGVNALKSLTKDADFIIVHHSCSELLPYLSDKKIIHYATGTKYRQGYEQLNKDFAGSVATFIALPEFQKLTPDFHYIVGAVDTETITADYTIRGSFGHFPSNPDVKGTSEILNILSDAGVKYVASTDRVPHAEQLARLNSCDVYIELLADYQGGKPYGSFGITALEAAALGKIVITQNNNDEGLYNEVYGFCGLNFAKDKNKLKQHIQVLSNYQGDYLLGQMRVTREWILNCHSYKATGERALKILNGL